VKTLLVLLALVCPATYGYTVCRVQGRGSVEIWPADGSGGVMVDLLDAEGFVVRGKLFRSIDEAEPTVLQWIRELKKDRGT
jgi:hypothetical protein